MPAYVPGSLDEKIDFVRSEIVSGATFEIRLLRRGWNTIHEKPLSRNFKGYHDLSLPRLGFPGEMEKFCTPEGMNDVDNPHALIYLHS